MLDFTAASGEALSMQMNTCSCPALEESVRELQTFFPQTCTYLQTLRLFLHVSLAIDQIFVQPSRRLSPGIILDRLQTAATPAEAER